MKKELNTRGLFITTILFSCIIVLFIIGVILICVVYSCNICVNTPVTYKNINTPNIENYEKALSGPNASPLKPSKPSMPSMPSMPSKPSIPSNI